MSDEDKALIEYIMIMFDLEYETAKAIVMDESKTTFS